MERRGTIEMLAAMIICGTIGITVYCSNQDTVSLIFFRCLFGAITLCCICIANNLFNIKIIKPKLIIYSLFGGAALLINWFFLFLAYKKTSIGIATTVYNTQPLMMVVIGFLLFKENITKNDVIWIFVSLTGLLFVSNLWKQFSGEPLSTNYTLGIGEALLAALFYAIASVFAKLLKGNPPTLIALFQMILGSVILWPHADYLLSHSSESYREYVSYNIFGSFSHRIYVYITIFCFAKNSGI